MEEGSTEDKFIVLSEIECLKAQIGQLQNIIANIQIILRFNKIDIPISYMKLKDPFGKNALDQTDRIELFETKTCLHKPDYKSAKERMLGYVEQKSDVIGERSWPEKQYHSIFNSKLKT